MTLVAEPAVESGLSHRKPFRIPGQGILLANVALVLVGLLILDVHIFSRASLSTLTPTIGVMILMALGQAFIIGTGGIDLSIPSTTTLVGAIVLKEANGDNGALLAAVAMALVVCIGIGLVNGLLVEVTRLDALVVTLATGQLIAGVTRIYRGPVLSISTVPSDLSDFARSSVGNISIILILAIAVAALIALWMKFHTSGRRLAASSVARPAAENSGLAAARQRITAWMVGSLIVGVGAVLLAGRIATPDLTLGQPYLLTPIVAVVLGGAALSGGRVRPAATALGAVFLVVLEHILRVRGYSSGVSLAFQGLVLGVGLTLVVASKSLRWSRLARRDGSTSSGRSVPDQAVNQENQE
ncbi:MAG TPA: ABC transporter permease [Nocardioides sp.]|uniref:ABC transporter permease n=1 Tax=uncultured Nocardioides sp. TaxID=198441 RepID=UPI00261987BC|nr:ABC transporter permease [uncultured Nocardioides sp.]HRD59770.1 ABC transporter permease [Nocardioides sp.]HRI96150.1 ABC transporter permease [Nocardioides sp.]